MLPPGEDRTVSLTIHDQVSDERRAELTSATHLLLEVTEASQYVALYKRHEEFEAAIQQAVTGVGQAGFDPRILKTIDETFEVLLSALRAFDDRTAHSLSTRYGKDSAIVAQFKKALSAEYDGNFAYRFCYRLRNYTQHCGSPIAGIRAGAASLPNGQSVKHCLPYFDSRTLITDYPDGWSTVKRELLELDGEFLVEPVVESLIGSCSTAYSKLLIAQEPQLRSAIEVVNRAAADASIDGGVPLLAQVQLNDPRATRPTLVPIRVEAALNAENDLRQAKAVMEAAAA